MTTATTPPALDCGQVVTIKGRKFRAVAFDVTLCRGPFEARGADATVQFVAEPEPEPVPVRQPEVGEVWRDSDGGALYHVHGHERNGFAAVSLHGSYTGRAGSRWSDPTTSAATVFDGPYRKGFTFYAASPRAAFDRLVRES